MDEWAQERDDRAWRRIQRRLIAGMLTGAAIGVVVGLVLGAIVFQRIGAILAAGLAGAIGIGGIGAFWGVLAALESPDPGHEPSEVEEPIFEHGLTREEHGRRLPPPAG
jgi:hypothetical protein